MQVPLFIPPFQIQMLICPFRLYHPKALHDRGFAMAQLSKCELLFIFGCRAHTHLRRSRFDTGAFFCQGQFQDLIFFKVLKPCLPMNSVPFAANVLLLFRKVPDTRTSALKIKFALLSDPSLASCMSTVIFLQDCRMSIIGPTRGG